MASPLRIALAGLGTVGAGVIRLLELNEALITRRAGRPITVAAVSARDRGKDRGVDISRYAWDDDMTGLASRDDVDVVVELVGGADGPALTLARQAIGEELGKGRIIPREHAWLQEMAATFVTLEKRGNLRGCIGSLEHRKALVTANKAMIAHHGIELASLAEEARVPFKFEAAVAGGIPVIKGLREGAAANAIERVYGILNGTCNYILSTMEDTGRDFADVLAEAQAKGFAEADPSNDIDGHDREAIDQLCVELVERALQPT